MRAEIKLLHQRTKSTTVYVTHDQVEAMTLGDRIAVMKEGQVQQLGTPEDIYARPATRFVAEFIGSPAMHMIAAQRTSDGRAVQAAQSEGVDLRLTEAQRAALSKGQASLTYGLRPEDVTVETEPGASGIHAVVTAVEYLGGEALVTCRIGERSIVARVRGNEAPPLAALVGVNWQAAASHVFDAATGNRVAAEPGASAWSRLHSVSH